ncbi:MAG: hypothetical protein AB1552_04720 [Nitrospirota bacterium]
MLHNARNDNPYRQISAPHNNIRLISLILLSCLMVTAFFLLCSCGKKGDPTLRLYEKPEPPSDFTAVHRESDILLSWAFPRNKESSVKGFILFKSANGEFKKTAFLANTIRSYKDSDFQTGVLYRYKIVTLSLKDVTSDDSRLLEATPSELPSPPENLTYSPGNDTLRIMWNSPGEGVLFNIYKREKEASFTSVPLNKDPLRMPVFNDSFHISKTVYYTVRSLKITNISNEGPPSSEIMVDPSEFMPSAPSSLQAVSTREKVYLIWKEPAETWLTGYRIYRQIGSEAPYVLIGETVIPSFIDTAPPSVARSYRVTAVGPSKEGPAAEIRDIMFRKQR